jgi:hypothetical protein
MYLTALVLLFTQSHSSDLINLAIANVVTSLCPT